MSDLKGRTRFVWSGADYCEHGHYIVWLYDGRLGYAYGLDTDAIMSRGDTVTEVRIRCNQPINSAEDKCEETLVLDRFDQPSRSPEQLALLGMCGQVVE